MRKEDTVQPDAKGFFASLFDLSFSSLITTRIIKVLYVLALIAIGLGYLVFTISAFASDTAFGVITLFVLGPIVALIYVVYARVFLEVVIALFRIMESNVEMVGLLRDRQGTSTPPQSAGGPPQPPPSG